MQLYMTFSHCRGTCSHCFAPTTESLYITIKQVKMVPELTVRTHVFMKNYIRARTRVLRLHQLPTLGIVNSKNVHPKKNFKNCHSVSNGTRTGL